MPNKICSSCQSAEGSNTLCEVCIARREEIRLERSIGTNIKPNKLLTALQDIAKAIREKLT